MKKAFLSSKIGKYLPKKSFSNQDISKLFPEWDSNKILKKVGINNRFICDNQESSIDLAVNAYKDLKEKTTTPKFDLVLYVSSSSQNIAPGDGHYFIGKFDELKNVGCIDINLGCSGYTYALGLSKNLVNSSNFNNILLITTDSYSKIIKNKDKSNLTLFGDGASASIVTNDFKYSIDGWILSDFKCGAFSSGYDDLKISKSLNSKNGILHMNGPAIFKFTSNIVIDFINKQNLSLNAYKVIFHQANSFMLNYMRKKLNIDSQNFLIDIKDTGNTVSSSIPIVISRNINQLHEHKIFLCGFGIGASYSSIILEKLN